MEVDQAFNLISHAVDVNAVANAYLLCGDLRGSCDALTDLILRKLFPDALDRLERRDHPDVFYLEPEGARRSIHVDSMREKLIAPMSVTSFYGGWKVGVIISADRMESAAANAFLKTLEEPPRQSLFILQTDAPDSILPTIISRCQSISLPLVSKGLTGPVRDEVLGILSSPNLKSVFAKAQAGKALAAILVALKDGAKKEMKKEIYEREDALGEDVSLVRKAFFKTLLDFMRTLMVAEKVPRHQAFNNIAAVEDAFRQCERSLNDEAVLCRMMDRITFP
jgi:DNA polymerase III subunit delta'